MEPSLTDDAGAPQLAANGAAGGPSPWWCYLLRCADDTLYCGVAKDPAGRVACHNRGQGARYTRGRRPVTLLYVERCTDKASALRRERAIKRLSRSQKLILLGGDTVPGPRS